MFVLLLSHCVIISVFNIAPPLPPIIAKTHHSPLILPSSALSHDITFDFSCCPWYTVLVT